MSEVTPNIKEQIQAQLTALLEKAEDDVKAVVITKVPVLSEVGAALLRDVQDGKDIAENVKHVDALFANMSILGRMKAKSLFAKAIENFVATVAASIIKNLLTS